MCLGGNVYISIVPINIYLQYKEKLVSIPSILQTNLFGIDLPTDGPIYSGQVANPQWQQRQPVTKTETPLNDSLVGKQTWYKAFP